METPLHVPIAGQIVADVASACEFAVEASEQPLRAEIEARIADVLGAAGLDTARVSPSLAHADGRLHVTLSGPLIPLKVAQAMAVRILDAVRNGRRGYREIDISYIKVAG